MFTINQFYPTWRLVIDDCTASERTSKIVKKISGKGQIGGFIISQSKIEQLIAYKHLLTNKQRQDILKGYQTGRQTVIKPTQSQRGGFLGTFLASIGAPIAVDLIKNIIKGRGAPKIGKPPLKGHGAPRIDIYEPPPFISQWEKRFGQGTKKKLPKNQKRTKEYYWKKQSFERHTSIKYPVLRFYKNIPFNKMEQIFEYTNKLLDEHNITLYSTENEEKSSVVEGWNRKKNRKCGNNLQLKIQHNM